MSQYRHTIALNYHITAFNGHLGKRGENNRIVFSAPFGSGKSFFLSSFFKDKSCNLMPVVICPVDYSVAANQDIFELIKHDILIQILESYASEICLQQDDVNFLIAGKTWINSKLDIIPFIGAMTSLAGSDSAPNIIHSLRQVLSEINNHRKIISVDEEKDIIEYLAKEILKSGSIREIDGMTTNIKDFIGRIKSKNPEKEVVLVIEDMDRLDPAHIFRIFNVFSSHTDFTLDKNKFGFDRVMFVCDITNLRHIFEHQYGSKVDFSGYISKFYSKEIFSFDLREALVKDLSTIYLNSLHANSGKRSTWKSSKLYDFDKNKVAQALAMILTRLVQNNIVKVRDLMKVYPFGSDKDYISLTTGGRRSITGYPILMILNAINQLFTSYSDLLAGLLHLSNVYPQNHSINARTGNSNSKSERDVLGWSIPFIVDETILLASNNRNEQLQVSVNTKEGDTITFKFKEDWDGILGFEDWTFNESNVPPIKANIYYFLYLAAESVIKFGYM